MARTDYLVNLKARDLADRQWVIGVRSYLATGFVVLLFLQPLAEAGIKVSQSLATTIFSVYLFFAAILLGVSRGDRSALEKGVNAENRVTSALTQALPDEYILINHVSLPNEKSATGRREIDLIVIGHYRVFTIEIKGTSASIKRADYQAAQWTVSDAAGDRKIRNPVRQAWGQKRTVETALASKGIDRIAVEPIVVFTDNPPGADQLKESHVPVFGTLKALVRYINSKDEGKKTLAQDRIAQMLIDMADPRDSLMQSMLRQWFD